MHYYLICLLLLGYSNSWSQESDSIQPKERKVRYAAFELGTEVFYDDHGISSFESAFDKSNSLNDTTVQYNSHSPFSSRVSFEFGRSLNLKKRSNNKYFNSSQLMIYGGFLISNTSIDLMKETVAPIDTISSPNGTYFYSSGNTDELDIERKTNFITSAAVFRVNVFPHHKVNAYVGAGLDLAFGFMNTTKVIRTISDFELINEESFNVESTIITEKIKHGFTIQSNVYPVIGVSFYDFFFVEYQPQFSYRFFGDAPQGIQFRNFIQMGMRANIVW